MAEYLIIKRGMYYKPNCHGYTVLKHEAGRYTEEQAITYTHPNGSDGPRDGMTYIHEDQAPLSLDKDIEYALKSFYSYLLERGKNKCHYLI